MPDIVIAFFALGLVAGLVKSDLKVPAPIYEILSILLMLTLGLKGGMALHGEALLPLLPELTIVALTGIIIPLLLYPVLRHAVQLDRANATSVAAHYGSVSAGTFAVALAMVEHAGLAISPQATLYLVLLELPAIVTMLILHSKKSGQQSSIGSILREALTSRGVLLLGCGMIIGWLYGNSGLSDISPVLMGGFKTLLALFLLEMGLCTAKVCLPLPFNQWRLMLFALIAPFVLASAGIGLSFALGLPAGSALILTALMASASYIAAPAAIRSAIPKANVGLALLASLGITFPLNVLFALPIYQQWLMH